MGTALVIAGAGSGKTTVLTRRVAYLLSCLHQEARSVLAVTFTNKAAAEMKKRVGDLVGPYAVKELTIGTFHSVCARFLRYDIDEYVTPDGHKWKPNFNIYDESDTVNVMKSVISAMNLDDKVFVPREIRHYISSLKNDGYTHWTFAQEAKDYKTGKLSELFTAYQVELAKNNALDFDDLILVFSQLLKQNKEIQQRYRNRFRHVLVDEFQDTNRSQSDLISMLCPPTEIGMEHADYWPREL